MLSRCAALLAALALAGGLGACGSDDELSTDIPRTSPDLTIPASTTEIPDDTSTTSTSSTTTTSTVPDSGVAPPPAVTPPPVAATPVTPPPSSTTGGAAPPTGGQSTTGGAQPGNSEFENFCRDNPGAGPPC
ncbi:MAG: hypothetical protein QOE31_2658 [Solirubrobacteraceae bacterium]|jgi:hypothetical protein|nr:hypothetical protein [Solirubrobacteraceae bacterium]